MAQKIILTGGKFNRIHEGHIWLLKEAKKLGYLVVVLANDSHNRRPYATPAEERKRNLEKLGIADKVVIGDKEKFVKVLYEFTPDIIVLGYDQRLPDSETEEYVKRNSIEVLRFQKHGDYETKKLV